MKKIIGAIIDGKGWVKPEASTNTDCPPGFVGPCQLSRKSMELLQRAAVGNALSGIVDIRNGEIHVYPLREEPDQDRTFNKSGDGYSTSRFPNTQPIRKSDDIDDPVRTIKEGATRARSMSMPGPRPRVIPIIHFNGNWRDGSVSHEQMARRFGGVPTDELSGKHKLTTPKDPMDWFLGFTVIVEYPKLRLVCASRGLNSGKFNACGKMTVAWANKICRAFDRVEITVHSQDDLSGGLTRTRDEEDEEDNEDEED